MARQIEKQILEIGLADLHAVQTTGPCRKQLQTGIHIIGFDFDNALCVQDTMFDISEIAIELTKRPLKEKIHVMLLEQSLR